MADKKVLKKLQLEKDILEGLIEILKKDSGANLKNLINKEKVELIDTLKTSYVLSDLYIGFYHILFSLEYFLS